MKRNDTSTTSFLCSQTIIAVPIFFNAFVARLPQKVIDFAEPLLLHFFVETVKLTFAKLFRVFARLPRHPRHMSIKTFQLVAVDVVSVGIFFFSCIVAEPTADCDIFGSFVGLDAGLNSTPPIAAGDS